MKFDAIIFDLDGVICHTDNFHYLAWKAVADQYGIPFDRTVNERLRGVSRRDSLEILLDNGGLILSRLGLGSFFDAAADGTELRRSKPDPEVFLLAAEKLRVPPCRAAVVEDAAAGIEAAKRGGFYAIGIGSAAAVSGGCRGARFHPPALLCKRRAVSPPLRGSQK